MTDARIAYSFGSYGPLPWGIAPRRNIRPSLQDLIMGATTRLLHLMVSAKTGKTRATSAADQAAQHEFLMRFQQVILPHLDAAYNFARFLSRDADGAQDIVQEAFLRAYRSFDSYRGGDPRAWLFAIVRNCCHAWRQQGRRKARYEQQLSDDDDGDESADKRIAADEDTPETVILRRSEQHRVRAVIDGLPEAMREILVLRELEDLSYREIAEIIDVPLGTVMSRLARARREFGEAWDACGERGPRL